MVQTPGGTTTMPLPNVDVPVEAGVSGAEGGRVAGREALVGSVSGILPGVMVAGGIGGTRLPAASSMACCRMRVVVTGSEAAESFAKRLGSAAGTAGFAFIRAALFPGFGLSNRLTSVLRSIDLQHEGGAGREEAGGW